MKKINTNQIGISKDDIRDIALRTDNINVNSVTFYVTISAIYYVGFLVFYTGKETNILTPKAILVSAVLSFIQVVFLQGYMMELGKKLYGNNLVKIITINVIIFTFMHAPYTSLGLKEYCLLAVAGFGFSFSYHLYPNVYLVTFFHFTTNIMALWLNMFTPHFN